MSLQAVPHCTPNLLLPNICFHNAEHFVGVQARQRALGNIQFIGHLYRKKMLSEQIMHDCIKKLLAAAKQEDLECLVKLMSTVGRQLDANPKAKMYMEAYFEQVAMLSKNMSLESRLRFMLQASVTHGSPVCLCCLVFEEVLVLVMAFFSSC